MCSVTRTIDGADSRQSRSAQRSERLWPRACFLSIERETRMQRVSRWPGESDASSTGGWRRSAFGHRRIGLGRRRLRVAAEAKDVGAARSSGPGAREIAVGSDGAGRDRSGGLRVMEAPADFAEWKALLLLLQSAFA